MSQIETQYERVKRKKNPARREAGWVRCHRLWAVAPLLFKVNGMERAGGALPLTGAVSSGEVRSPIVRGAGILPAPLAFALDYRHSAAPARSRSAPPSHGGGAVHFSLDGDGAAEYPPAGANAPSVEARGFEGASWDTPESSAWGRGCASFLP